ncbi:MULTISPECIES: acyl-CoA carboxylase epsilon subunit [unclassified Knoellia]|uniref:acyl-CoA carboxylase epsilon subunit n=1 Tax=Knoellia altitudinis TaxID=3404795 RepID=UPI00361AEBDF
MTSSQAQSPGGPGPVTSEPDPVAAQAIEVIGDATPEQVAALVAVLSAASGGAGDEVPVRHTSRWSAPAGLVRRPVTPGSRAQGTWQHSLR